MSINSCLAPVGSLDGMAITTVEGIGNSEAGLHGVQSASTFNLICADAVMRSTVWARASAQSDTGQWLYSHGHVGRTRLPPFLFLASTVGQTPCALDLQVSSQLCSPMGPDGVL